MVSKTTQNPLLEFLALVPEPLRTQVYRQRTEVHRGENRRTLIDEDIPSTDVFFLREGEAEVRLYPLHRPDIVYLHTLRPGDVFGEIAALDGKGRSANVEALSEVVADVLRANDFIACLHSSPAAGIWLAQRMAASVRRLSEKVFELTALNVSARIHCELLRLAATGERAGNCIVVDPAPNQTELAKRVGTSRDRKSTRLGYLSDRKILEYARPKLVFIDLKALERLTQR